MTNKVKLHTKQRENSKESFSQHQINWRLEVVVARDGVRATYAVDSRPKARQHQIQLITQTGCA